VSAPCPSYGFAITVRLAPGLDDGASGALWDAFIAAVEARGLSAGGGGDQLWHHVISRDGGQAIDADREALRAWAEARPDIVEVSVGPLVDLDDPDA
jgi:uncharacterized protein YggL (DUF469 family)